MHLRKHQKRFLDEMPSKALLCWEMRTGKSLPASIWAERRGGNSIIVCPKQLVKDWQKLSPISIVYSKENFKKNWREIKNPTSLIIDEAHTFGSSLFTKKRSQLSTAMYYFIKENPLMGVLLLTATPIRNDPSSLHTLLCFIGKFIPWEQWRSRFYTLEQRPYIPRPAYFPKSGWQKDIRNVLEEHADIVSLKDCIEYMPKINKEIARIKSPKFIRDDEYHWTKEHLNEQTNKIQYIKTLGYRKIIIVCHYTAQIDEFKKSLSSERQVFVLDGRTKNAEEVKRQAQESDECYFIVQASMGFGFDGYMFGALVFSSMSHRSLDHTQMLGRLTNVDNPVPQFIYYLIGGRWDKRIYDSIMLNEDFNPHSKKYDEST